MTIGLLIFIPLGYLFVLYRNGFLGLDLIFSRVLYLVLLSLTVYSFYMGSYRLMRHLLGVSGGDAIGPTTIIFFPTLLLTIGMSKPVNRFVNHIIYRPKLFTQAIISELTAVLASKPETGTLQHVVIRTAALLHVDRTALSLQDDFHQAVAIGWGDVHVEGDDLAWDVPDATVTAVYRVLIESLNNVVKHARNAQVNVSLRRLSQQLELCIADNGPGYQLQDLSFSELLRRNHLGIMGMHEWTRMVQGELRLVENKPKGLAVLMRCPI